MIKQFFSTIQGWLYAVLGLAGAVMYALLRIRTKQRDIAHTERDAAQEDAESATELANTQSELSRAQQQAREEAKHEKPITRPKSGTDFNSL